MTTGTFLLAAALYGADAKLDAEIVYTFGQNGWDAKKFKVETTGGAAGPTADGRGIRMKTSGKAGTPATTSLMLQTSLQGDFIVTAAFELLDLPKPTSGSGAGVSLVVANANTPRTEAHLGRRHLSDRGEGFTTAIGTVTSKDLDNPTFAATKLKRGRLRMERRANNLTYSYAPDDQTTFVKLGDTWVSRVDIAGVGFRAYTGGSATPVDVVWKSLMISTAAPPGVPVVQTIDDKRIVGSIANVKDGRIFLDSTPPKDLPLDEISHIEFDSSGALRARWIGQVDKDFVGATAKAGKNGVQDVQITLSGISSSKEVSQVRLVAGTPKDGGVWLMDTTKAPSWRLNVDRVGRSTVADLYFEPFPTDLYDQLLSVAVIYSDGSQSSASVKATSHTDSKRKVGSKPPAVAKTTGSTPAAPRFQAQLVQGDRISGELVAWNDKTLELRPDWGAAVRIPREKVASIRPLPLANSVDDRLTERMRTPAADDTAFVKDKDDKLTRVDGKVAGVKDGKLVFVFDGRERTLPLAKFMAAVFGGAKPADVMKPHQYFELASGDAVAGAWTAYSDGRFIVKTSWGDEISLPGETIRKLSFRNGRMMFLSDIEPSSFEETPYFEHKWSYRKDQTLAGEKISIKSVPYAKGVSVHSRSVMTYDLSGSFNRFRSVVGFDDSIPPLGRVDVRVTADGKELFKKKDLRADGDLAEVDVDVTGVKQLSLEVDFGAGEDVGDRVVWANPRLFRNKAPAGN